MGRLSSGLQSDHGTVCHAVVRRQVRRPPCPYNDWGRRRDPDDDTVEREVSLCGKSPGKRSVGWKLDEPGAAVTCDVCLRKLERQR
jgi:hypothetical protein